MIALHKKILYNTMQILIDCVVVGMKINQRLFLYYIYSHHRKISLSPSSNKIKVKSIKYLLGF